MKIYWQILIICGILSLLVINDFFSSTFPYTHDGENHLARFANYKVAVREGQIPPRFAPNLLNHYGYPVFNFNYPLANIASLPFSALRFNYELTFKLILFGSLVLGGLGVFVWVRNLGSNLTAKTNNQTDFQLRPILLALGTYYSAHYLTNAIIFRGSIGEIMAYGLFPWLMAWVTKPSRQPFYIFIWSAFFLSHNLIAFFGTLILLVFSGYWILTYQPKFRQLLSYILIPVLGFGLSLWFWLPAVFELNLVAAGSSELITAATNHFPTLRQLFFAPLEFGFSYPGTIDSLGFSLGAVQWLIIVLFGVSLWFRSELKHKMSLLKLYFIGSIVLILLQLSVSSSIWHTLSFLQLLQFPWRLSFFISILLVPLAYILVSRVSRPVQVMLYTLLIIQLTSQVNLKPVDQFSRKNVDYEAYTQSTSTQNENTPHTFKYLLIADWQPTAQIIQGSGTVAVQSWSGSKRLYQLTLDQPSVIVEPTAYFLGWESTVVSILSNDAQSARTKLEYIDNDQIQGRIAYALPSGVYEVTTVFTQNTPARTIGNFLSFLSLVLSVLYFWYQRKYFPENRLHITGHQ